MQYLCNLIELEKVSINKTGKFYYITGLGEVPNDKMDFLYNITQLGIIQNNNMGC